METLKNNLILKSIPLSKTGGQMHTKNSSIPNIYKPFRVLEGLKCKFIDAKNPFSTNWLLTYISSDSSYCIYYNSFNSSNNYYCLYSLNNTSYFTCIASLVNYIADYKNFSLIEKNNFILDITESTNYVARKNNNDWKPYIFS